jgi:hypothetical protein
VLNKPHNVLFSSQDSEASKELPEGPVPEGECVRLKRYRQELEIHSADAGEAGQWAEEAIGAFIKAFLSDVVEGHCLFIESSLIS